MPGSPHPPPGAGSGRLWGPHAGPPAAHWGLLCPPPSLMCPTSTSGKRLSLLGLIRPQIFLNSSPRVVIKDPYGFPGRWGGAVSTVLQTRRGSSWFSLPPALILTRKTELSWEVHRLSAPGHPATLLVIHGPRQGMHASRPGGGGGGGAGLRSICKHRHRHTGGAGMHSVQYRTPEPPVPPATPSTASGHGCLHAILHKHKRFSPYFLSSHVRGQLPNRPSLHSPGYVCPSSPSATTGPAPPPRLGAGAPHLPTHPKRSG